MAPHIITRSEARAQGLRQYFTGKPCKRGHVAMRQVSSITCMECSRDKCRARYDKEKNRENGRRWREANREKDNARRRLSNKKPERKVYKAAWFQANKARVLEQRRANPNSSKSSVASAKRWAEANPEKAREYSRINRRTRRARAKNSGGTHTASHLAEILKAQGNRCAYCRSDLKRAKKNVDHIIPLARGGSNGRANLQYLCRPCNQSKSARDPVAYAQSIGLLL